ncbi:hypothetical protein L249_2063 [Ophiocordyceps polyrhachis-furcata BCC 54312]|uniref:Arginine biosynthesis bifunctional protein ArgJ, mitochondrial n=1 Tax=Ophiocordyceps polyrhachis-furcata BCC 54312 TaxID=1330021 RepID=A0A367LRI1_9HYPO|nr:hypothetical protein L249_2063 [Ophiocordyceps polyrhachis-furcata BCC 54312]
MLKYASSRFYSILGLPRGIPSSKMKWVPESGIYPKGFKASGVYVGIKPTNLSKPDLALVSSDRPCAAAAVFTKNNVIVNSGNANAVTGARALQDTASMAKTTDDRVECPDSTLVMSTGVIGEPLPIKKILDHISVVYYNLGDSHEHWLKCADAIRTTDSFPKLSSRTFKLPSSPGIEYRITGMSKGAGMVNPNMATLLGILATDAPVDPSIIKPMLKYAVDRSFNAITIDGDTSTNDTIALLANGAAGGNAITSEDSSDYRIMRDVVTELAVDLAKLVVRDGEGCTKFVTIRVVDCRTTEAARAIAIAIATSPLVKTALHGGDANWGRILCAIGYALITPPGQPATDVREIDPDRTDVSFIPSDGSPELKLLVNGEPDKIDEVRATEILRAEDLEILVRLGTGDKSVEHWTCDLTHEYVTINSDYRT